MQQTKNLLIHNDNNKLACNGFLAINVAPRQTKINEKGELVPGIREKDFDQVFSIKHEGKEMLVKLDSFIRLSFNQISSCYTIPGYGIDSFAWKAKFLQENPRCDINTPMAVYFYIKINPETQ